MVFQTASTQYLSPERYAALRHALASARGPVAWLSTRRWEERSDRDFHHGYELEAGVWPEGSPHLVARMGYHGQWLDWSARGVITSRDNETLKLVRKLLGAKKHRDETGLFAAEGEDLVAAARAAAIEPVHLLVADDTVEAELMATVSTLPHPAREIGVYRIADLPAAPRNPRARALAARRPRQRRHADSHRRRLRRLRCALGGLRRSLLTQGCSCVRRGALSRAADRMGRAAEAQDRPRCACRRRCPRRRAPCVDVLRARRRARRVAGGGRCCLRDPRHDSTARRGRVVERRGRGRSRALRRYVPTTELISAASAARVNGFARNETRGGSPPGSSSSSVV